MSLLETFLPNGWQWSCVGDFYEVTRKPRGMMLNSADEIPFAPMEAIPQGGETKINYRFKARAEITSGTYFERGDLLIAKITPSFENGKQGLADDLGYPFGYATTEVIPLRPKRADHDRRLLFYFLLHPEIRTWVAEKMEGSTGRQRVPERVLLDLPFPDIDPKYQTKIAESLSLVKALIRTNIQKNEILEHLFRSLMHRTLTGQVAIDRLDWSALEDLRRLETFKQ
jgi:type I restriction enzyme S subunit